MTLFQAVVNGIGAAVVGWAALDLGVDYATVLTLVTGLILLRYNGGREQ